MTMRHRTDIAIIGGGASGLAASLAAARSGAAVLVLEQLPRVGKKLLATGNGRCNLGHVSQNLVHFHGSVDVAPILEHFPGEASFFRDLGLFARPDEMGRLYPASGQAASVVDALRLACAALGVQMVCDAKVTAISPCEEGFLLDLQGGGTVCARRVILAAGGAASPQNGTEGAGLRLAADLGHRLTECYPALAPIAVAKERTRALRGLRVQARVTAFCEAGFSAEELGQVQFADGALSGICVFNLATHRPRVLSLDLLPWCEDAQALVCELAASRRDFALEDMLTGLLPKRVGQVLLKSCTELALTNPVQALDEKALRTLAQRLKDWKFPTVPGKDWKAAQVTAGGVTEVFETLESRLVPGLYFAGEVLDVHGDSGGFNLRWAWASGTQAGKNAARGMER